MRLIALEYHDVIVGDDADGSGFPGRAAASYKLSVAEFDAHLDALAALGRSGGCAIGGRVEELLASGADGPPPVLFTFDDGGVSFHDVIAERLEARGWHGHFFITTDYIGSPGFMDATRIRALHGRGHVVGSHSCSHPTRMAACTREQLSREWKGSVDVLAELLGASVRTAGVPGGYYSPAVADAAAESGIEVLFTSEPTTRVEHVAGCAVVGRYTLRAGAESAYAARLAGTAQSARAGQWLAWNLKKLAKRVGGPAYLRARSLVLPER